MVINYNLLQLRLMGKMNMRLKKSYLIGLEVVVINI